MGYTRVAHGDPANNSSSTDATVVINAMQVGLELVEGTGSGSLPNAAQARANMGVPGLAVNNVFSFASGTQIALTYNDNLGNPRLTFTRIASTATQLQILSATGEPAILGLVAPNGTDYADFTFDGATADIDVQNADLNLRPLTSGKNVTVWSTAGTAKLRVGSQNFGQALDISHDGTNAHITPTSGYVGFQGDNFQILSSGAVNYTGPTTTSASAGSNGATPAQVGGYITWQIGGTTVHIPYYL